MKEKGKTIFLVFLVVLFVGYLLVTAVLDLTNKKDIYTVNIDYAGEVLAIEHSIGGLIPIGKDHYYLGVDEDTMEAVFVKGSKNWLSKNFDSEGNALTAG